MSINDLTTSWVKNQADFFESSIRKMKGYDQLFNQYELMNVLYHKAELKLSEMNSSLNETDSQRAYLKELYFIIGKEALIENGNWYLILKEKEPGIECI